MSSLPTLSPARTGAVGTILRADVPLDHATMLTIKQTRSLFGLPL